MSRTDVVQIPLDTKEFDAFASKFDSFRDQLARTPGKWKEAGAEMTALAATVEKMQAAARKAGADKEHEDEGDKERFRRLKDSEGLWDKMAHSSSTMAKNVLDIGTSLLKWGGLLAGGALFGSLFGIDRLAHSIGNTRSESMGFGMSPAALQAFTTNFGGKGLDTQSFLSSMLGMETDITKRAPWYMLSGGKAMSGDTTQDSLAYLQSIRDWTQRTDKSMLGTLGAAYQVPLGAQDLNKIQDMKPAEWSALMASFNRDQKSFGLSNTGAKAWQDLSIQIERTGTLLKDKFAVALEPLVPSLVKLSVAAGDLIAAFLKSPAVKTAVDDFSKWLEKLPTDMDASSFLDGVSKLKLGIVDLADLIHTRSARSTMPSLSFDTPSRKDDASMSVDSFSSHFEKSSTAVLTAGLLRNAAIRSPAATESLTRLGTSGSSATANLSFSSVPVRSIWIDRSCHAFAPVLDRPKLF